MDVQTSRERKLEKPEAHKVKPNKTHQTKLMKWIFVSFKFKSRPRLSRWLFRVRASSSAPGLVSESEGKRNDSLPEL